METCKRRLGNADSGGQVKRHRVDRIVVSMGLLISSVFGSLRCREAPSSMARKRSERPVAHPAAADPRLAEFLKLEGEISEYNGTPPRLSGWVLNSEHLFADADSDDPESLLQRVIGFSRKPGALDLLFDKLLQKQSTAVDKLVVTEILVYFGQYHLPGDDALRSVKARDVERALQDGLYAELDKQSDAPIQRFIQYAVDRAIEK